MRTSRRRYLTIGRLMIVIGVAALAFALTRVDTAPGVSLCVFAACTWYLASRRFAETMARRSAEGLTTSRLRKACVLAWAAIISVVAIGVPDAAFLAGYYGYMKTIRAMMILNVHENPYSDPWHLMTGAFFGIIAALYVTSIFRGVGPIVERKPATTEAPAREPIRLRPEPERVGTGP